MEQSFEEICENIEKELCNEDHDLVCQCCAVAESASCASNTAARDGTAGTDAAASGGRSVFASLHAPRMVCASVVAAASRGV